MVYDLDLQFLGRIMLPAGHLSFFTPEIKKQYNTFGQHILNKRCLGTLRNSSPSKVDLGMSFQYVSNHLHLG